ncbi:protein TsetseEP-like isoform X2 [Pseudoliparis swirei]|uniref:protein TsetseEP-like isoform X2 n=1 Tax=Pseudoliparis swirei TaxID=2059687 RepID=UPI0024BDABBA|nr:protein TsetseEP-like isoform X2 [Pseudoliparis swirei]
MSKAQMLRGVVNQRLTAAAQEICGLFEGTIAEYEEELCSLKEENERHRKLLHAVFNPEVRLQRADVQQLLVVKEEVLSEQQVWISSLDQVHPEPPLVKEDQKEQENPEPPHIKEEQEDQENPEPPHIKEEQENPEPPHIKEQYEELWTGREGEQLQGLEEAGLKLSFTPVKAEEEAQSSKLHQRQTEPMEIEADGDDCGGPEPARNADPDRPPDPDEKTGDSSEPDTDDSVDWKKTREPQSVRGRVLGAADSAG